MLTAFIINGGYNKVPPLVSEVPTSNSRRTLFLDQGALVDPSARRLADVGVMGVAAAEVLFGLHDPAILKQISNGSESNKGNGLVKAVDAILRMYNTLSYEGYMEGDELMVGNCNVALTDGFTGNVLLKGVEGTGRLVKHFIVDAALDSVLNMSLAGLAVPFLLLWKKVTNPSQYNGAIALAPKLVVKSHGGANPLGFARAIIKAAELHEMDFAGRFWKKYVNINEALREAL